MKTDSEKLLSVSRVAQRLSLDESTVRRMSHKGMLKRIRTGPALKSIRIYESSLSQHIKGFTGIRSNTGKAYC